MEEIVVRVLHDYTLYVGGPRDAVPLQSFVEGQTLTLVQTSVEGDYPRMFRIKERPRLGELSLGVLDPFTGLKAIFNSPK